MLSNDCDKAIETEIFRGRKGQRKEKGERFFILVSFYLSLQTL
jgi:hypothetical protein